jgi:DNA-binding response OmpR family regulator
MARGICQRGLFGRRILIVEDRFFVADDLRQLFTRHGAEIVAVVADADQAARLAETGPIDVAVLDVDLRGRDVFDAADILAARGTAFIFVTGYREVHLPERFRRRPIVPKPFSETELLEKVDAALRGAEKGR